MCTVLQAMIDSPPESSVVYSLHAALLVGSGAVHDLQDRAEAISSGTASGAGQNGRPGSGPPGARLFPFMLQQRCPDLFSYGASSFKVQRSKAGTARVVCWQELGIPNRSEGNLVH